MVISLRVASLLVYLTQFDSSASFRVSGTILRWLALSNAGL